jgi:hypothetical protein
LPHGAITYETNSSLCYIRRTLDDGKYLAFIRNTTDEATDFTLHIEPSLTHCYWFDAMTGNIHAFEQDMQTLTGRLKSFGSIAILCSPEEMFSTAELPSDNPIQEAVIHNTIPLTDWKLEVIGDDVPDGTFVTTTDVLEDWSKHEDLKYVSSVGTYTATLPVSDILQDKRYMLDLGVVFAVADVAINGQNVGQAIFSPYQVDITDHLVTGDNTLIIEVTPALRNRLLGKALAGDPEYRQFIGRPPFGNSNPIPSGLVGPVNVQIIEPNL